MIRLAIAVVIFVAACAPVSDPPKPDQETIVLMLGQLWSTDLADVSVDWREGDELDCIPGYQVDPRAAIGWWDGGKCIDGHTPRFMGMGRGIQVAWTPATAHVLSTSFIHEMGHVAFGQNHGPVWSKQVKRAKTEIAAAFPELKGAAQ